MGVKHLLWVTVTLAVTLLTCLVWPVSYTEKYSDKLFIQDVCIVTYPEFLTLMMDGEVTVTDGDMVITLVKTECGWKYLRSLSILVKAE